MLLIKMWLAIVVHLRTP